MGSEMCIRDRGYPEARRMWEKWKKEALRAAEKNEGEKIEVMA